MFSSSRKANLTVSALGLIFLSCPTIVIAQQPSCADVLQAIDRNTLLISEGNYQLSKMELELSKKKFGSIEPGAEYEAALVKFCHMTKLRSTVANVGRKLIDDNRARCGDFPGFEMAQGAAEANASMSSSPFADMECK